MRPYIYLMLGLVLFHSLAVSAIAGSLTARTATFIATEGLPAGLLLKQGATFVPLNAPLFSQSPALNLDAPGPLEFFVDLPVPNDPKGTMRRTLVGSAVLPIETNHALIVLFPVAPVGEKKGPLVQATVVDNSITAYPSQHLRVINLTPTTIAFQSEVTPVSIPSGEFRVFPPTRDARFRLRFKIAGQLREGWSLIDDSRATIPPDTRLTILVVYAQNGMAHTMSVDELARFDGKPPPSFFVLRLADRIPPKEQS